MSIRSIIYKHLLTNSPVYITTFKHYFVLKQKLFFFYSIADYKYTVHAQTISDAHIQFLPKNLKHTVFVETISKAGTRYKFYPNSDELMFS